LKNGNQCSCFEELPVDEVFFVNDVDESDTCNMTCPGSDLYKCGGESSYSIYIASEYAFFYNDPHLIIYKITHTFQLVQRIKSDLVIIVTKNLKTKNKPLKKMLINVRTN
jgi:hypothetical protein